MRFRTLTLAVLGALFAAAATAQPRDFGDLDFSLDRGLRYSAFDGDLRVRLGGRIQTDFVFVDDDETDLNDDIDFRRVRLTLRTRLFDDWTFRVSGEVSPDREGVRQLSLGYTGFDDTVFIAGNQAVRLGLDAWTSSNNTTFLERSLADAFSPGLVTGLTARTWDRHWNLSGGVYGPRFGNEDDDRREAEHVSVLGRISVAPYRKKRTVFHLGSSVEYRAVMSGSDYRIRTRPESGSIDRLVSTGRLDDVDDAATFGIESAFAWGPFSVQGEYMGTKLFRGGASDTYFDGGYVQASYVLTGERRRYRSNRGAFGRIQPDSKWGAFEVAARFSTIDLTDEDVIGGEEDNYTIGLNWYFLRNFRVLFNFIQVDARREDDRVKDEPRIFQIRLQGSI